MIGIHYSRNPAKDKRKPGEMIEELSPADRELLEEAIAEDFSKHRMDEVLKFQLEQPYTPGRRGRLGKYLDEEKVKAERLKHNPNEKHK
jgi:hypothetical protein